MKILKRKDALLLIQNSKGRVFSCTTIKRMTGEIREFRARLAKYTRVGKSGGQLPYNAAEKGLIPIYLMMGDENRDEEQSANFRMINVDGIQKLVIDGIEYAVEN